MRHRFGLRHLFTPALVVSLVTIGFAQGNPPGVQPFSTNNFGVDLANSNIHIEVPLRAATVGPNPLSLSLVANFGVIDLMVGFHAVYNWVPPQFQSVTASGLLGAQIQASSGVDCGNGVGGGGNMDVIGVVDASGAAHSLSGVVDGVPVDHSFTIGQGPNCGLSGQGTTVDGSGYTIVVTYDGTYSNFRVYDRSGNVGVGGFYSSYLGLMSVSSVSTPDGIATVSYAYPTWTDALTSTPLLTESLTGGYKSPGSNTYSFTDANGTAQHYTVSRTQKTMQTNFGCNFPEYPATTVYLATTISLPGSNGAYTMTYEPTPGYPGSVTGRIASITYPSGGSVSYAYSGGTGNANGYNCSSGVVPTLKVTVNDNNGNVGTWKYVNSNTSSGTGDFTVTKTDPAGNQTVYSFAGEFQTQAVYYQGAATGTPLKTVLTCYNGNLSNCAAPSTAPTLPIAATNVYTSFNTSSSNRVRTTFDLTYGNVISVSAYDFGASNPTSQTFISYGQSWNGSACTAYPSGTYIYNTPCYTHTENSSNVDVSKTQITYSNTGHPTSTSRWVSGSGWLTSTAGYNANGTMAWSKDAAQNQTSFTYAATGSGGCNGLLLTSTTYPVPAVGSDSQTWDCNGGVTSTATDVNGNVTSYAYNDPLYRLTQVTYPDSTSDTLTISYDTGNVAHWKIDKIKAVDGSHSTETITEFDGLGREIWNEEAQDPNGPNFVRTLYNNLGQVYSVSNRYYSTTDQTYGVASYTYDALGRVTQVTNSPDNTFRTTSYNGRARLVTDESGIKKAYQSDGLGRLQYVCDGIGAGTQANNTTTSLLWAGRSGQWLSCDLWVRCVGESDFRNHWAIR
jgi:YD repeat-containing protein